MVMHTVEKVICLTNVSNDHRMGLTIGNGKSGANAFQLFGRACQECDVGAHGGKLFCRCSADALACTADEGAITVE